MSQVEVRLMQRVQDKTHYFEVLVSSKVKVGLKNKGILEFDQARNVQAFGILAGALAEEFCEKYSDTIEPSNCAREAMIAYRELMSDPNVKLGDEIQRDADRIISHPRMVGDRRRH